MAQSKYLSPAKFRIFAHRGTTELGATENTLQAFEDAIKTGADYIETDVQATADGVAVVFHDPNLKRLVGASTKVSDITYPELKDAAHKKGFEVSTLIDALKSYPGFKFNIDVKSKRAIKPVIDCIIAENAQERVLVSSFSCSRRMATIGKLSGVATSADSFRVLLLLFGVACRSNFLTKRALAGLDAVQIPVAFGPLKLDGSNLIQACHDLGVEVHYWTINSVQEANRLKGLGADGIVTDRCKLMSAELAE